MKSLPEAEVRAVAVDVKPIRVLEVPLVAVGRPVQQQHH